MSSKIGEKIKMLRNAAGLSLNDLAQKASIEGSLLERIENNIVNPSVAILVKISKCLGTRVGTIVDGIETTEPVLNNGVKDFVPENDVIKTSNLNYHLLAQNKSGRSMEPSIIDVEYVNQKPQSTHEGEEFLYVLEGNAVLEYGKDKYSLSKGDSIYFDSIVPHCVTTASQACTARILAISYMPSI